MDRSRRRTCAVALLRLLVTNYMLYTHPLIYIVAPPPSLELHSAGGGLSDAEEQLIYLSSGLA